MSKNETPETNYGKLIAEIGTLTENETTIHVSVYETEDTKGEKRRKVQISRSFTSEKTGKTHFRSLGRINGTTAIDLGPLLVKAAKVCAEMPS